MAKVRNHNEWFMPLVKRKCPCGERNVQCYAWGEYSRTGKWNTVKHFCQKCFAYEVKAALLDHAGPCGCTITLVPRYGYNLPEWINLNESKN